MYGTTKAFPQYVLGAVHVFVAGNPPLLGITEPKAFCDEKT